MKIIEGYVKDDVFVHTYKSISGRRVRIYKFVKEYNVDDKE